MQGLLSIFLCGTVFSAPVVLNNHFMEVQVDAQRFAVLFVGEPGGPNFLEVLPPPAEDSEGRADGGGLETHLVPFDEADRALRWGPGEIVAQSDERVMLVGRRSAVSGLLIRKTITLYPGSAKASYRVSVEPDSPEGPRVAVRNLARLAPGVSILIDKTDGVLQQLTGLEDGDTTIAEAGRYWSIGAPPPEPQDEVLLGSFSRKVLIRRDALVWVRRLLDMPRNEFDTPYGCTFLAVLDTPTATYAAALQSATRSLRASRSLVFREIWELDGFEAGVADDAAAANDYKAPAAAP